MKSVSQTPVPPSHEKITLPCTSPIHSEISESSDSDGDLEISDYEAAAMKRKAENQQLLKSLGLLKVYDFPFCWLSIHVAISL